MTATLTSMAILKVNADRRGRDTLDNFLPIVLDRLYHLPGKEPVVSLVDLRTAIGEEYGLWLPGGVLQTLTKRLARKGLLRREAGVLHVDADRITDYDLTPVRTEIRRAHGSLVQAGVKYAADQFGRILSSELFEAALQRFIQANAAPLLATIVDGHSLADPPISVTPELDLVVAAFIAQLAEAEPEEFRHLSDIVKGSILATALYFPSQSIFEQRLSKVAIYLDTPVLLRAIGASGPDLQALAAEVIALGIAEGAQIRCFSHTLVEVQGVLSACAAAVRTRRGYYYGEAAEYMVSTSWEYSDVVALSDDLEATLNRLGVSVVDKPEHEERLTLDEVRLEESLQSEVHYRSEAARRKDVDSVTAIYRLRRGTETISLARAKAVFVTSNYSLSRAVRKYMRLEEGDRETVPLCVPDYVVTSILWLMRPIVAPDLPVQSLIADSYATMQADQATWHQYVVKIEELKQAGRISDDNYLLLRQSLQVRALILVDTGSDPEAFTEGSAERVVARARENITAEAQAEARAARDREVVARAELVRVKAESDARMAAQRRIAEATALRLDDAVDRVARVVAVGVLAIFAIGAAVGAVYSIPAITDSLPAGLIGLIISVCVIIFAALGFVGILTERGFPWAARRIQAAAAKPIRRWLLRAPAGGRTADTTRADTAL
jgi:hypothetical protein